jgi:SAM-dependent methyltransferase
MRYRSPPRRTALIELGARALYFGKQRYCTVCKSHVRVFKPYGSVVKRQDALCPVCDAVERHRFTWAFFERRTNLFDGKHKRMLHVAPEAAFEKRLRQLPYIAYRTSDPQDDGAELKIDITAIPLPDDSFDVIHCSHVLEHIQEDERAMRELARVLAPGGWATILVPIIAEATFDDPSVTDPKERARLFGQWDHVRAYGKDFAARLAAQGFDVRTVHADELVSGSAEALRLQFKDEQLFFCRKR